MTSCTSDPCLQHSCLPSSQVQVPALGPPWTPHLKVTTPQALERGHLQEALSGSNVPMAGIRQEEACSPEASGKIWIRKG